MKNYCLEFRVYYCDAAIKAVNEHKQTDNLQKNCIFNTIQNELGLCSNYDMMRMLCSNEAAIRDIKANK